METGLVALLYLAMSPETTEPATTEPATTEPIPPEPATAVANPVEVAAPLVIDSTSTDAPALREELTLRLPDRAIDFSTTPRDPQRQAILWVGVRELDTRDDVELRLITSDGRLYRRTLPAPPAHRARVIASAVANMIDAIERDAIQPTAVDVEIPPAQTPLDPSPPQTQLEPPPPPLASTPTEPPPPSVEPAPRSALPLAWSVWLGSEATVGVGPPTDASGVAGMGGTLGLGWRHRRGAMVATELRVEGWDRGVRSTRLRAAVLAGYGWRWSPWSLVLLAGPTVEGLWIDATLHRPSGARRGAPPLFGGRVTIRSSRRVWGRDAVELHLGVQLDGAGSVETSRPLGAVRVVRATDDGFDTVARAGGGELSAGLVVEVRFSALP